MGYENYDVRLADTYDNYSRGFRHLCWVISCLMTKNYRDIFNTSFIEFETIMRQESTKRIMNKVHYKWNTQ